MTTNYIKQRLLELITAQDSATHCNENKLLDECRQHQAVRDEIRAAIAEDFERLEAERDSALAALAAAQAMTQELAQMRTLIVEVRDKVARLERQLMTADERRLAEVHRAGK